VVVHFKASVISLIDVRYSNWLSDSSGEAVNILGIDAALAVFTEMDDVVQGDSHTIGVQHAREIADFHEGKHKPLSRRELIAAQRAASLANQKLILPVQTNSVRGVDVLLPGNAVCRSSLYEGRDKRRYSYVSPSGSSYDITDIVEEIWRQDQVTKDDLLEGIFRSTSD
jgi:hypothetical protein